MEQKGINTQGIQRGLLTQKGGGHGEILETIHEWPACIGTRGENSRQSILATSTFGRDMINVVVQVLFDKDEAIIG